MTSPVHRFGPPTTVARGTRPAGQAGATVRPLRPAAWPATDPSARGKGISAVTAPPSGSFRGRLADAGVDVSGPLVSGPLSLDLDVYEVSVEGRPVELSPRQVEVLAVFLASPSRVWSREQLHWLCWADTTPSRRVDVQLCRIRARVGIDLFRNVRDRGWALRTPLVAVLGSF